MKRYSAVILLCGLLIGAMPAHARTVMITPAVARTWAISMGDVRGIVHDPQHRPVKGADVSLRARASKDPVLAPLLTVP